jgi:hypothetical protein
MRDFDYSKAKDILVEVNGKEYKGSFLLEGKVVTVTSPYGTMSTQLGGLSAEGLARILFKEILSKPGGTDL